MSLKKGFLRTNRQHKSSHKQHNQRLFGLILVMVVVLVGLIYFGYVRL